MAETFLGMTAFLGGLVAPGGRQVPWPLARLTIDDSGIALSPTLSWFTYGTPRVRLRYEDVSSVHRNQVGWIEFRAQLRSESEFVFIPFFSEPILNELKKRGIAVDNPYDRA